MSLRLALKSTQPKGKRCYKGVLFFFFFNFVYWIFFVLSIGNEASSILVHWPKEDAVCIVKEESIVSPLIAELWRGDQCSVKIQNKTHVGIFVDIGGQIST